MATKLHVIPAALALLTVMATMLALIAVTYTPERTPRGPYAMPVDTQPTDVTLPDGSNPRLIEVWDLHNSEGKYRRIATAMGNDTYWSTDQQGRWQAQGYNLENARNNSRQPNLHEPFYMTASGAKFAVYPLTRTWVMVQKE